MRLMNDGGSYAPRVIFSLDFVINYEITVPMGINAKSKDENFSPISLNAGQVGSSAISDVGVPRGTARYPVSPPNHTLAVDPEGRDRSVTAQELQRVL